MGDNNWWANRIGSVAHISNPGSTVPNYGLTFDTATAPYDSPDQFDAVAAAIQKVGWNLVNPFVKRPGIGETLGSLGGSVAQAALSSSADYTGGGVDALPYHKDSWWDKAKDAAGWAGRQLSATAGEISNATEWTYSLGNADVDWSWGGSAKKAHEADAKMGKAISGAPGAEQLFWGLQKVNEYASTAMVASSLAEDDFGKLFKSGTWGDAHQLTKDYSLNAGEAFAQMFYDNDVIQDPERFKQLREHSGAFGLTALAFNVIGAWKADPNVFLGKGIGAARDFSVGRLAVGGRTREVQRDILSAATPEEAVQRAGQYAGIADTLRAAHATSLYGRSQQLRYAAQNMGYEAFKTHPAFANSASGATMAKVFQDVANDDDAWNLVFRTALGDPRAVDELITRQADLSDKIAAIEMKTMPRLQSDLERTEARYQKRLADQGLDDDARIEIVKFGDKWLDDEVTSLRSEVESVNQQLGAYSDHESWVQRALPGLDEDTGRLDPNAPNSIFGNLDRLGGRGSLRSLGGKVTLWQRDDYSPVSWIVRAPGKPMLKRVGVVSLNDVDEGATALTSYLNQLDYIQGGSSQAVRDRVLGDFAGASTDVARKDVVQRVEREAIAAVGRKYGLSVSMMDQLGRQIQSKRAAAWGKFTDTTMYSPIRGGRGQVLEYVDDAGNKVHVKMPLDPTQLQNHYPLANLTDIDRTIRENLDSLRDMDKELASRTQAGVAWTKRHALEWADEIGTTFNSLWKPMALLSIRWPMRVVGDESMRAIMLTGFLPHMAQWGSSAGHALYNTGVVRPYEWWNGRKVRTGSLVQESLSAGRLNDFDAYDYRAITNPTAAVPIDELDFGKLDKLRYDKLNQTTAKRWQYLRKVEAHVANTREASKVSQEMADAVSAFTGPKMPAWAVRWNERLVEAENSAERGFFFDPVTHRATKNGFAVSTYPGRLRTFERRPTARDLNYWTEKNSDLLAIPNNRVAVWLDKDTGRWNLDVVKTTKRREDAMLLASKTEATEFYDIADGFTRYMSEDFYNHFTSPFTKAPADDFAGGVAFDQSPLDDASGFELGQGMGIGSAPGRKATGFGKKKWRTRDGRVIEGEGVFGAETKTPNVYYSVVSSRDPIRNLYGGYTRATGANRLQRVGSDYRVFDPTDPNTLPEEWAKAYAYFVNNHVRYSPLWSRMVNGQSDDEIYDWLMHTAKGRQVRKRMGVRGENPGRWLDDEREVFDHLFPNDRVIEAVRIGQISPEQALGLVPEVERMTVHGDSIKLALGQSIQQKSIGKVVDWLMNYLGSVPTDALVRHPFAANIYNREMANYLSSVPADKITNNVLAAAEASARAKAIHRVRRTLYNIADEREGVHLLRFVSPFFQAQLEVLERYARISMEKPETLARIAQLLQGSQTLASGFWQVTDENGKPAEGYSGNNLVVFQVGKTLRGLVDHIPGLQHALDYAGDLTVPVSSLNLILQGKNPFLPSLGPLVTIPASEFYFKGRPELEGTAIYNWLYPFGQPQGSTALERGANALLPAWARRLYTAEATDMSDAAFARRVSEIGAQQQLEWERGGKDGPRPTERDALEAAKTEYRLRAASSFFLPAPVTPRSPYQPYIEMRRDYINKFGAEGDRKFYDEVGPDLYLFAQQATESTTGMGPSIGEKKAYDAYKGLIERAPQMTAVLTGPFATGEFSDSVYQWQLDTPVSPGSTEHLRERLSPAERIAGAEVSRGWVEYGKLATALDAELRYRVASGGSPYLTANSNADLAAWKSENIDQIIERNPAWQDAYNSRSSQMGTFLNQAYDVAFDKSLDNRPDIQYLRAYLIGRARLQDALRERKASGYSSSDQLSFDPMGNPIGDNADLAAGWLTWIAQAKAENPLFADVYNRYLEGDDLSTYIPPEVSGG